MLNAMTPVGKFRLLARKIRADDRYRRAVLSTSSSVCTKVVSAVTTFASIAAAVRHLGPERYGLYATVTSLSSLLVFADLGIGNTLITRIAQAHALSDWRSVKKLLSSAYLLLILVSIFLAALFFAAYPSVPWRTVFNVSSPIAISESGLAAAAFIGCFLVIQPLSIVQKVHMGFQQGYINEAWTAASSVIGLVSLIVAIKLDLGTPGLLIAVGAAPVAALLASNLALFWRTNPWIRPDFSLVERKTMVQIFRSGMLFLVLQLGMALAYVSDHFVIAQLLGPKAVADYSVPSRLFALVQLLVGVGLTPMWPAYGEALASSDFAWVKRTFSRTLKLALLFSGSASIFLLAIGRLLVELIGGSSIQLSSELMLALAIWTVIASAGNAVAMFLNGANVIRFQVVAVSLMAVSAFAAKLWLVQAIGIQGAVWGTIIGYVLFSAIPCAIYVPRLFKNICRESL